MSTAMIWQTVSTNSADTEKLGQLLGQKLQPPVVVELVGDLGAGKTTFGRGLAHGLGSKDTVSSPSFTLSNIYKAADDTEIHHFDFYRLREPGVIADQLVESIDNPEVVTLLEWSSRVKSVLPADRLTIKFKLVASSSEERQIQFHYPEKQSATIKAVETDWVRLYAC